MTVRIFVQTRPSSMPLYGAGARGEPHTRTVIIASTAQRGYPTHANVTFQREKGQSALDQIRTANESRVGERSGALADARARGWQASFKKIYLLRVMERVFTHGQISA